MTVTDDTEFPEPDWADDYILDADDHEDEEIELNGAFKEYSDND